jgi:hypothetical protein
MARCIEPLRKILRDGKNIDNHYSLYDNASSALYNVKGLANFNLLHEQELGDKPYYDHGSGLFNLFRLLPFE